MTESFLEKVTIDFPRLLKPKEVEDLLKYLNRELQYTIQYMLTERKHINRGVRSNKTQTSIAGTVRDLRFNHASFNCFNESSLYLRHSHLYFSGLRFQIIPEYASRGYVALIDAVREKTELFFIQ